MRIKSGPTFSRTAYDFVEPNSVFIRTAPRIGPLVGVGNPGDQVPFAAHDLNPIKPGLRANAAQLAKLIVFRTKVWQLNRRKRKHGNGRLDGRRGDCNGTVGIATRMKNLH